MAAAAAAEEIKKVGLVVVVKNILSLCVYHSSVIHLFDLLNNKKNLITIDVCQYLQFRKRRSATPEAKN